MVAVISATDVLHVDMLLRVPPPGNYSKKSVCIQYMDVMVSAVHTETGEMSNVTTGHARWNQNELHARALGGPALVAALQTLAQG